MDSRCIECGNSLTILREGAKYCSHACKIRAYRRRKRKQNVIPPEMRQQDRWLRWKKATRRGKVTKVPMTVEGRYGSSTNAATWASFGAAESSSVGHGVGFALGSGIGCIDLDGALNDSGKPLPWATEILERTPATFIEISQSGRGLHIFGLLPEAPGRNLSQSRGVEVYSTGRFIAMTGLRFNDSPASLADITGLVTEII